MAKKEARCRSAIIAVAVALLMAAQGLTLIGATVTDASDEKISVDDGLIEYVSRQGLKEKYGDAGWKYRKKQLLRYAVAIRPENEVSLKEHYAGEGVSSRTMSQAKIGMVFRLLMRMTGEEGYSRIADMLESEAPSISWHAVRARFEKETGRDLAWFFQQWVDRKGLPRLNAEKAAVRWNGGRFEVSFDLVQEGNIYTLDVPVYIAYLQGGGRIEQVSFDSERKKVVLFVDEEPGAVVIDRDYDIPRRLTAAETPPLIAKLAGAEKPVLVPPANGSERYADVLSFWNQRGAEERRATDLKDGDVKGASLLVFDEDNPVLDRLFGKIAKKSRPLRIEARKNPWNDREVIVIVDAQSVERGSEAARLMSEEGDCSSLEIDARGRATRKMAESDRGIIMEVRTKTAAIDVSALKTLPDVIEMASDKRIVYVGEYHDQFAHHAVQMQVIKNLYEKDPRLAVGMEMFQRPFQMVLDEYIRGDIDEREFLRRSEYFSRWRYDFNLYKPILDFARAEKIPVVALNLGREIIEKVSKSGMDSLGADEKKDLPGQMDFSDAEYRERLMQVFAQHKGSKERSFDFFYQAQILWDETMAQSIDEYLQENADRRMVVVAGVGHLAYGSGIPKRVERRHGYSFATILNDADVDADIGDYLLFPEPLDGVTSPKLMVLLQEKEGNVSIIGFPEESVSKQAGMKKGDRIAAVDGAPVKDVSDLKIALFYKASGDTIRVKVVRKYFLFGERELECDVKLQ